ncbi:MAG: hypothetical protein HOV80_35615 [Polyangiaceae bacterium]|nr:hypothetical protein [Polyangiaceae bacterium]
MKRDDPHDPNVAGPIEEALAAYRGLLSAEDLEEMREFLEDVVVAHPVAALLRKRLGPAKVPIRSEEQSALEEGEGASEGDSGKRSAGGEG